MQIEKITPKDIVYFRCVGPYGRANKKLMVDFKNWVKSNNLFYNSTILGVALDDPKKYRQINADMTLVCSLMNQIATIILVKEF